MYSFICVSIHKKIVIILCDTILNMMYVNIFFLHLSKVFNKLTFFDACRSVVIFHWLCKILFIVGNKGAVGVSFNFSGTSFCFVNAHLTSGDEKNTRYTHS